MDQAMASRPQTDDTPVVNSSAGHSTLETGPLEDERRAVLACRAGDRNAFRLIVERYGDLLTGTAYLMLGDRSRAEETVQDALVDAWRGLDRFDAERPLRPWLLRVLVNRVMQVRRRKLFGLIPLRETRFEIAATDLAPDALAEREWERDAVRQALGRLEPDAARLVFLRYFAELPISEIAEVLAIPEGTVKSRLHRARGQLRDDFARRGILGEELS